MRRARIKALAAVPMRKKLMQDVIASDISNDKEPDEEQEKEDISSTDKEVTTKHISKEQKEEDASSIDTIKQEAIKDVTKVKEQKEIIPNIDISEQDAVNHVTKVQKEIIKKEQNNISSVKPEPIVVEKKNSQEMCSQIKSHSQQSYVQAKSNFQEPCTQTKPNFQESSIQINDKPGEVIDQSIQKSVPLPNLPTGIDIVSPTKTQNRTCFMRPTPRLDSSGRVRKNSIQGSGASASESEDEHGKRAASIVPNRIRNDSICSVQSNKESTTNENQNNSPRIKTAQKRRMLISESARRLAEARREFLLKYENKTPDKNQLKMYDYIYYNPVTNPMTKSSTIERKQITTSQPVEVPEEEDEDDPSTMPAPQVKVGPDGQLIVDEQSLVIEQSDAKRGREILANEAIIEDENSRGGFYKKHKRSKDWPKWETFKFYRVLNVVGTDFLLMQTLFPNRTRQEIKQKYKKEERVNRQLVEKALKYHQEFNTERLEEQLAMLQKLENIQDTSKKTLEKIKSEQRTTRIARRRRHRLVANSIGECEALSVNDQEAEAVVVSDEMDTEVNNEANNALHQQTKKGSKARKLKKRLNDKFDEFDDNSSYASLNADSDSSPEVYRVRPTRSGRLPRKVNKLQAPNVKTLDSGAEDESSVNSETVMPSHVAMEITEIVNTPIENGANTEMSCPENITNVIPNINQMEPGSLVIVSKESTEDPGNTILQVYMVSSNIDSANTTVASNGTPMNPSLTSLTATTKLEDAEPINVVNDCEK